jgi:DNA polymerase-3 subunit chi
MSENPCEVWFYHLERTSLDAALPELLEKTVARGWRALVRSTAAERVEHLDGWLWSYREDSFLAHGTAEEPMAERQPILITAAAPDEARAPNQADVLFLIDGADPGDISPYQRCILLFDGRDEEALAAARKRWSAFKSGGHTVSYWRQGETSGWRQEA